MALDPPCIPLYKAQFGVGVCNQPTHAMGQGSICITNDAALALVVTFLLLEHLKLLEFSPG